MLKNTNIHIARVDKLVSFIQHDLPGLKDGKYRLQVSQTMTHEKKEVFTDPLAVRYTLAVAGDRFAFSNPADTIYSVFPPDNASGRYNAVLPSAVFTKTSLPWSRSPLKDKSAAQLQEEANSTDKDVPTWLTVLLLDEEDLNAYNSAYPDFTLIPRIQTIGDLFPDSVHLESTLGDHYSYFKDVAGSDKPVHDFLDPGQQLTDPIQTLDLPVPLFRHIAPTVEDLNYMAHIRKVSLVNKATMSGISDIGEPEGSFSIVFGNRLPGSNRKIWAYLVSLESMEELLPSSSFVPDPAKMVRVAVLKVWNFYSTGDNAAFVDRLKRLNGAIVTEGIVNKDLSLPTTLRIPPPGGSMKLVAGALRMGYVPLNHLLRSGRKTPEGKYQGEKTVSWYRSPLCPYPVASGRIRPPLVSADQAALYDPTTGMFDLSYACAWNLGRMTALQDASFSTRLYNWKKQLSYKIQYKLEREHLADLFADILVSTTDRKQNQDNPDRNFIERTIVSLKTKR